MFYNTGVLGPVKSMNLSNLPSSRGSALRVAYQVRHLPVGWQCTTFYAWSNTLALADNNISSVNNAMPMLFLIICWIGLAIFQGVPGAFSESAAGKAYPNCEPVPCEQFDTAFEVIWPYLLNNFKILHCCVPLSS